mgnify:CR=1 FL=1
MSGANWARDLGMDLDAIRSWGADAVITLIEPHEFEEMQVQDLGAEVTARGMDWHNLPIVDVTAPGWRFEDGRRGKGPRIRARLTRGERVFVHCKGGLGRAGTVAARLLVELGLHDARSAIATVRAVRPGALETRAQEQHVEDIAVRIDRAAGCLLGLAIGDTVGTTLEFKKRDTYEHLTDMVGGGPFHLPAGVWTDDTSMALALADSLIASRAKVAIEAGQGRYGATIGAIVEGSWRDKTRDQIASSGYVAHSLEAALWCLARTDNYRDAVLLAANLGDDADTTAAITGQLAGALYGRAGLPDDWVAKLAWRHRIEANALDLIR